MPCIFAQLFSKIPDYFWKTLNLMIYLNLGSFFTLTYNRCRWCKSHAMFWPVGQLVPLFVCLMILFYVSELDIKLQRENFIFFTPFRFGIFSVCTFIPTVVGICSSLWCFNFLWDQYLVCSNLYSCTEEGATSFSDLTYFQYIPGKGRTF